MTKVEPTAETSWKSNIPQIWAVSNYNESAVDKDLYGIARVVVCLVCRYFKHPNSTDK
jgi:hypothetical protein